MKITRVLIANRGECAVRIASTLRRIGIESIMIFTESDANAAFLKHADHSVCVGGVKGYLDIKTIVDAGLKCRASAVHPGYGFLSENPVFAKAVTDAGMIFIGPDAAVIDSLGSKIGAKRILKERASSVPLIPGFYAGEGESLTVEQWAAKAEEVGFPLLIKAAAGGGGKGMRVVRRKDDFTGALESCRIEARGAFGSEAVLLERYFERVRHIEVQVLGDKHGNVCHAFERECSVQRRHQKLVEECPSTALNESSRKKICDAAVEVAKSVGYSCAGTVEFIYEDGDTPKFYFLEVNTRLQVEHCVTELCTNIDIVHAQVLLASGVELADALNSAVRQRGLPPIPPQPVGFSVEVRVYAEDESFIPCVGTVAAFSLSPHATYHCATEVGSKISVDYDGLVAKVIVHSTTSREHAVSQLLLALKEMVVFGVVTNRVALINLLKNPSIFAGKMTTDMIDAGIVPKDSLSKEMVSHCPVAPRTRLLALGALFANRMSSERRSGGWGRVRNGWSNGRAVSTNTVSLTDVSSNVATAIRNDSGSLSFSFDGNTVSIRPVIKSIEKDGELSILHVDMGEYVERVACCIHPSEEDICNVVCVHLFECGAASTFRIEDGVNKSGVTPATACDESIDATAVESEGDMSIVRSPLPAKVVRVVVPNGSAVKRGDVVVILESMKMETKLTSPCDGTVNVSFKAGDTVAAKKAVFSIKKS